MHRDSPLFQRIEFCFTMEDRETHGVLSIEIKYGVKTDTRKLAALKRFVKARDLPLGIVVNNAETPELIADRIIQLPVQYL